MIPAALTGDVLAGDSKASPRSSFIPGEIWPDNNGVHINAHGGGVIFHEGTFYWFGEHKIGGRAGNVAHVGVHVYSSSDLYNWTDEGIALPVSDKPGHDIESGAIIERPKVIYNASTGRFVMWFHLEFKGQGYRAARSGVAVAERPAGPYSYLGSVRPNAGHWPINVRDDQKNPDTIRAAQAEEKREQFAGGPNERTLAANLLGAHFEGGQMARDMTLFVDDDGVAYHIYSSEHNSTLHISELSADYLEHTGRYVRIFEHRWMEAPALFKRAGNYYLIASGCTGWNPNAARSAVAKSIFGPWKELENPCIGINPANRLGPEMTFGGQSTFVLQVPGMKDAYIAMFDLWRPDDAIDGRYLWLPIEFAENGFEVKWRDEWDLVLNGREDNRIGRGTLDN
jgi:hypothetical protein